MIEVKHLKLIDAIAEVGTLKKAAEKLFLTQSALSHQLKELETHLGTQVFYRVNNQLHFTPLGKEFRDSGRKILKEINQLQNKANQVEYTQPHNYIHGYSDEESRRLNDQAYSISDILHRDSEWEEGKLVLEAGCGVGAQTKIIALKNPEVDFTSIDISEESLSRAKEMVSEYQLRNVTLKQANVLSLPFADETFDHVIVCFLLEHLSDPLNALHELKRVLKKKGSITVIEGDHGSAYFHPHSEAAQKVIEAQVLMQNQNGGNAIIGRTLFPLLKEAGYTEINVTPRQVYVDDSKPVLQDGFIKNTFTAMINGIKEELISNKIISEKEIEKGIVDLYKTAQSGGTFCYTFFKASAILE